MYLNNGDERSQLNMKLERTKKLIGLSMIMVNCLVPTNMTIVYANQIISMDNDVVKINEIPILKQFPELPTGCEATALTMLLNYYGVDVSKQDVANSIPREPLPYYKNGVRYGGNPNKGFVGNPYSSSGYGVFEAPIIETINKFLPNQAENLTGKTLDELLSVVKSGRPVMIWATIGMENVVYKQKWQFSDGQAFTWPGNEHALLMVGYDTDYIYMNDPYSGTQKKYKKEVVENRYNTLGRRAVAVQEVKILDLKINEELVDLSNQPEILYKNERILIPVSHLKHIVDKVSATYRNNTVYLNILDTEIALDKNQNTVGIMNKYGELVHLGYEIDAGTTLIDLKSLTQILPITYSVEENSLLIKREKVIDIVVNNVPISLHKDKNIAIVEESIFIPAVYIEYLTNQFRYGHVDGEIYIEVNNQPYRLDKNKNTIDIMLDYKTIISVAYLVEDGVTKIKLDDLTEYLGINYIMTESTLFIEHSGYEDSEVSQVVER